MSSVRKLYFASNYSITHPLFRMCIRRVLLLTALIHTSYAVNLGIYDCPKPWVSHANHCYKFDSFPSSISDAKASCDRDGAALVSVNSREENDFIERYLADNTRQALSWFTSGRLDPSSTGPTATVTFTWEGDGTEVSGAQFWFNQACRSLAGNRIVYYTDGSSWGWCLVDENSTPRLPYICEISKQDLYKIVSYERSYDYGLNEIDPLQLPRGPLFYKQPRTTIHDTGSTQTLVTFNCEAAANPLPTYSWFVWRDQKRVPVNLTDQGKTVTNGRLTIQKPDQTKDNGDYQCMARNSLGAVLSDWASLSFAFLNDFPKSTRDPVRAVAYQGVPIQCIPPTNGYATLSYAWYKETFANLIRSSVKWYIFISNDGTLYFQSVTRDDVGDYYCVVTRPNSQDNFQEGKISMPIPLIVSDSVGSQQEPQIVNSFPKAFPSSPMVGDNLRLECVAWGTEQLMYSWSRIGGDMPTGASFADYNRVVMINNVQLVHAGTYRCTVSRVRGTGTWGEVSITIEARPYFTIPITNEFVDVGKAATFRCYATGIPTVAYSWYVNSTKFSLASLPPADRVRYNVTDNVFLINNVQPQDAGMYQCAASNTHGSSLCSAELRTFAFPPNFNKYPLLPNTYGVIGSNVTLMCQPESAPTATKQWLKDGADFSASNNPDDRVVVMSNGNLRFSGVQDNDAGNYTCVATNNFGTASTTGQLTILPATAMSFPPQDVVVMVNTTAFFPCEAMYNPAVDITYDWWHNNYKIMFIKIRNLGNSVWVWREPNYIRGTGINQGGLFIRNVQFFHAGRYECIAKSTTNEITSRATLIVVGPPGEPAGVIGQNAMSTSIQLSWWPSKPNGHPVLYYIVEIYDNLQGYWKRNPSSINITAPTDTLMKISAEITGLSPYTQYKFRALGVNKLGEGVPSQESVLYRTTEAPPITYPSKLGGGGGKVGTVNITWEPMPVAEWNAGQSSVGYIVSWKKASMNDDQWDSVRINDPTAFKHVVTVGSENFYLPYNIRIQSFNAMGVGPVSPTVTIMSSEDIPKGVPIGVRAVYFNATAIIVEWRPVDNTREVMKGVLLGYRINYWVDGEQNETMALFKVIHNQTDHGMIIALRENTFYMINVQAINTAGNGPKSENYRTRTLRAAPMEAPQDVRVSVVDYQSILIQWRGVFTTINEEPLEGYTVRYWLRGENIYVATNVDAGKSIRFVLGNLKQQTMYVMRVFGYSRGGDGLQSSPEVEFVLGSDCAITEDSPDKEYVYTCRGCRMKLSSYILLSAAAVWLIRRFHLV